MYRPRTEDPIRTLAASVALLSLIKHKPIDVMEKDRADRQTDRQRDTRPLFYAFSPGQNEHYSRRPIS